MVLHFSAPHWSLSSRFSAEPAFYGLQIVPTCRIITLARSSSPTHLTLRLARDS